MPRPKKLQKVPTNVILGHINAELDRIKALSQSDPEAAHSARDTLYVYALTIIGRTGTQSVPPSGARTVAQRVLKARNIKLRWQAAA